MTITSSAFKSPLLDTGLLQVLPQFSILRRLVMTIYDEIKELFKELCFKECDSQKFKGVISSRPLQIRINEQVEAKIPVSKDSKSSKVDYSKIPLWLVPEPKMSFQSISKKDAI